MVSISILGYYGQKNTGDEAILSSLLAGISEHVPHSRLTVFSGDVAHTKTTHQVNAVQSVLPDTLSQLAVRLLGSNRKNFVQTMAAFFKSEIILIGGGGLFIDQKDSNTHLMSYLRLIRRAKGLGKKVMLAGVSVGPLHHPTSRTAIADALNVVDLISVRDAASKDLLVECGVLANNIRIVPDFVYSLSPCPSAQVDRICATESLGTTSGRAKIAITLCSYNSELSGWLESYVAFSNYAIDSLNAELWFIPMQTLATHDDRSPARMIKERIYQKEFAHCIEGTYGPREILGLISRADAVLSERLHGSIMALNASVPFFGIGYMPKVTRLFDEIGHPEWCLPITELSPSGLTTGFGHIFKTRDHIAKDLVAIATHLKKQSAINFDYIKEVAN